MTRADNLLKISVDRLVVIDDEDSAVFGGGLGCHLLNRRESSDSAPAALAVKASLGCKTSTWRPKKFAG
jgi:hypothetical protein